MGNNSIQRKSQSQHRLEFPHELLVFLIKLYHWEISFSVKISLHLFFFEIVFHFIIAIHYYIYPPPQLGRCFFVFFFFSPKILECRTRKLWSANQISYPALVLFTFLWQGWYAQQCLHFEVTGLGAELIPWIHWYCWSKMWEGLVGG